MYCCCRFYPNRLLRDAGHGGLIIGMTSQLGIDDESYFRAHGANEVLPKPFNLLDFEVIVEAFIDIQQRQQQQQQKQSFLSPSRPNELTAGDTLNGKLKTFSAEPLKILVVDDSKPTR